ncbi:hypothetical protein ACO0LD_18520 [Undibacterium sp. Ji83W]|uniref:hypothetical protein n=1 Tax=Undibacterium sp. Ji83W TaxID=3413043 RepID=UPI003BF1E272
MQVRHEHREVNGVHISGRYENDILTDVQHMEKLPSGKSISKEFDRHGKQWREKHWYGFLDIMINIEFTCSQPIVSYTVKKKVASKKKYELARVNYPDMPAADQNIVDFDAAFRRALKEGAKLTETESKVQLPDVAAGLEHDEWCGNLIAETSGEDAFAWFDNPKATLGLMSRAKSRRMLTTLQNAQCGSVFACDIDRIDSPYENTGHLVIELPQDSDMRKKVFKLAGRIVQEQGYDASPDNGQKYLYLKLD